jgi:NAD(P)-dependent dehydrogenase (short-subunit alcohol dehydrogenase family)
MVKKYVSSCIPLFQIPSPSFNSLLVSLTGRYGLPEEVAGLVKFLALDPAAAYITGQVCPAALVKFHTNYTEYVALQGFGGVSSN